MNENFAYLVIGSGRQGTAAAFDMVRFGNATRVVLADIDIAAAKLSAYRINQKLNTTIVESAYIDVNNSDSLDSIFKGIDVCLSAVPYFYNFEISKTAVQNGVSICDLGGNMDIARQQHNLDSAARAAGVSVVPNCGQVPGMGTSLIVYAMEMLDQVDEVCMWDGGLPQNPKPPFNYQLTFNISGLTNEYAEPAIYLKDYKITQVEPLSEVETIDFPPPFGRLEAFVTGGGIDTLPWTYEGKVRSIKNLTLRYPGHYSQLKAYYDLGLWNLNPISIDNHKIVPRDVFHTLFEPKVNFPDDKDMVIIRVKASGALRGKAANAIVEVFDYYNDETGFSAMERTTGWSAAIVAELIARRQISQGAGGVEKMVPASKFVNELKKRGVQVKEWIE